VAFQLIQEVTAHAQSDSPEDAREICADGTYFPNNLSTYINNDVLCLNKLLINNTTGWLLKKRRLFDLNCVFATY